MTKFEPSIWEIPKEDIPQWMWEAGERIAKSLRSDWCTADCNAAARTIYLHSIWGSPDK